MLDYTIETEFFNSEGVVKVINYEYTDHFFVSNMSEVQSNNKIRKEVYKYPFNYSSGIYTEMTNNNMLLYPVEELKLVDNGVTGGSITTFKFDDGIIVPDVFYRFASTTTPQQAECEFNGSLPNTNYWLEYIYFNDYIHGT